MEKEKGPTTARPQALQPVTGVLAATDLQHDSIGVLEAAAAIARRMDARLHAAYVFTSDAVPRALRSEDPENEFDFIEEARRGLWLQMEGIREEGTDVASVVVVRKRSIHEGIVDVARASGADLIVMGSHARTTSETRLGSTADRVLRTAPVPCLVVRGEARFPIRRAAVLTDFSPDSGAGLRLALSWLPALGLDDAGAHLDVIHCTWPEVPEAGPPLQVRRLLETEIAAATSVVPHPPHTVRPRAIFSCYPHEATADEVRKQGYQLVVVATHGRGAVARALIGSVTLGLVHTCPCPVLVVPPARRRK